MLLLFWRKQVPLRLQLRDRVRRGGRKGRGVAFMYFAGRLHPPSGPVLFLVQYM